jgi:Peptide-N-glycosidase F, C terminal
MKFILIVLSLVIMFGPAYGDSITPDSSLYITVFDKNIIHFNPDSSAKYNTDDIIAEDKGRIISTNVILPAFESPLKITAHLEIHPIPKDYASVYDPWDRAGHIKLVREGMADIEIVKFITSYGGFTEYDVDISYLSAILYGDCNFKGFIDTWSSPGWKVNFSLKYEPTKIDINPDWVDGLLFEQAYTKKDFGEDGIEIEVLVPDSMQTVKLYYFVSGHCTDGTDADEFIGKDNIIYVDEIPVYRYQPWRDDCRQFRAINPYTRRWSEGVWSSDFSRSGWCPGDVVDPLVLDLLDHLKPGRHKVKYIIEDVRPENEKGDHGYWRISSFVVGWKNKLNMQNY